MVELLDLVVIRSNCRQNKTLRRGFLEFIGSNNIDFQKNAY